MNICSSAVARLRGFGISGGSGYSVHHKVYFVRNGYSTLPQMGNGTISLQNSLGSSIDCEMCLRHITVSRPNPTGLGLPRAPVILTETYPGLISRAMNSHTGAIKNKNEITNY